MIKRRSLLIAAPALILPKRFAQAQLPLTGAGPAATGGAGVADTWDPASVGNGTLSGGNLIFTITATGTNAVVSTINKYNTGKRYLEITWTGTGVAGSGNWNCAINGPGTFPAGYAYSDNSGSWHVNGAMGLPSTLVTGSGQVVGMAVDFVNNRIWAKSTASPNWNANPSADPVANVGGQDISPGTIGSSGPFAGVALDNAAAIDTMTLNVTNGTFSFGLPTGYTVW
jgi:hypothetical protein